MATTVKRKEPREVPPKVKVLDRPPEEVRVPPSTNAQLVADKAGMRSLAEGIKLGALQKLLQDYKWVDSRLPEDPVLAVPMVRSRLYGQSHEQESFTLYGSTNGLAFNRGGELLTTWPWEAVTNAVLLLKAKREEGNAPLPQSRAGGSCAKGGYHSWIDEDGEMVCEKCHEPMNLDDVAESAPKAKSKGKPKVDHGKLATPPEKAAVSPDTKPGAIAGPAVYLERNAMIDLKSIDRHPLNRHPKKTSIEARAASMQTDGQRDACEVRKMPGGRYQMISGETRWLSAQSLKWKQLRADVIECDDIEARRRVVSHNAEREDVNAIDKARYVEELCKPVEQGGNGYTRERAAQEVGLQTGSAASNLVKLLRLPAEWQERVASGQLPESFARIIVPFVQAPNLMKEIEKDWQQSLKRPDDSSWESRSELERFLRYDVLGKARWMDGKHEVRYEPKQVGQYAWYPRLFKRTPEIDTQCGVCSFELEGETIEVATNAAAFDKLNIPLVKEKIKHQYDEPRRSAKRDNSKSEPKKLTPAEAAKRRKEQADHLRKRIQAWRHQWLKRLVVRELNDRPLLALRICLWMATHPLRNSTGLSYADPEDRIAHEVKVLTEAAKVPSDAWAALRLIAPGDDKGTRASFDVIATGIAQGVVGVQDNDPKFPVVSFDKLDDFARECEIDLAREWHALQQRDAEEVERETFASFFALHQSDQLDDVLTELGVKGMTGGKSQKLKQLTGVVRDLKLPKSIKPIEPAKAGKRGGK